MKQRYAYLRQIPHILAAWIQNCPYVDVQQKYIAYMHGEAPHPEYLGALAKELGRAPEEMRRAVLIPEFTEELQLKATAATKKSLQLKILGQNALCERFITKGSKT